jgi:hypothetical protein
MAPSVEGIKRFLDFHYGEKNPDINKSGSQSQIQEQSIEVDNSNGGKTTENH